jgi:hypothetical protein
MSQLAAGARLSWRFPAHPVHMTCSLRRDASMTFGLWQKISIFSP